MMPKAQQIKVFKSGNEGAVEAARQINYHVMGYYPITPSTQVPEGIDLYKSKNKLDTVLIAAEGEHSAAGICYGASAAGARVINATSANGLLYSIEQLPVQSGTRMPMVLNVACRTVSGPLSIKGDHSDIVYTLTSGWIIFFAHNNQQVYDFNIIGLKVAERLSLPVIVAYDGFFTSHQKYNMEIFENDEDVKNYIGKKNPAFTVLDTQNPVTLGSYMNEPDIINNKYQLSSAVSLAEKVVEEEFKEYEILSGRKNTTTSAYKTEDADIIFIALGSAYETAKMAVDVLRKEGLKTGALTINLLRPLPDKALAVKCKNAKYVIVANRQDSYGTKGGELSRDIKSAFFDNGINAKVISRIFGLGGRDFYVSDCINIIKDAISCDKIFDYYGVCHSETKEPEKYFDIIKDTNQWDKTNLKSLADFPKRLVAGHGACAGCGIPVNINLFLKGIKGNVVLLFHTGCGMVVTTAYPKTAFRVNYVHNLFQNGAATLSGIIEAYKEKQRRGEIPDEKLTFIMVSGDGGMDIGLGSAIGAAIRNHNMIIFEYDNGGYMNTGYQLSYSTPMGAKSSTSHGGKAFFNKDSASIFKGTGINYIATVSESNPMDMIKKAQKAQYYADNFGLAYIKAISVCPLNWRSEARHGRKICDLAVKSCYHPLFEIEKGITKINYNPEIKNEKIPVSEWFKSMGRTKDALNNKEVMESVQNEVDRRWKELKNS